MSERKCAVVTGASSNIGEGIAICLAENGYDVAITYSMNEAGAAKTKAACEARGARCFVYQAFLNEPDMPAKVVDWAHRDLGRIDAMICNAGHGGGGSVIASNEAEIDDVFDLDYRGYMLGAGAAARYMIQDKIAGNIIFISSSQGEQAYPANFIYNGAKAAINHSCRCLALDLSHYNIRVNVVAPGQVRSVSDTPSPRKLMKAKQDGRLSAMMNRTMEQIQSTPFVTKSVPCHRAGVPADIAQAVLYLIDNDRAGFITGVILRVDGGLILTGLLEGYDAIPWARPGHWETQYRRAFGTELADLQVPAVLPTERKCAVVTGASSNIGQGIAVTLAREGYDVAITYSVNESGANDTKEAIELLGRRCFVYQAFLQEPGKIQEIVDKAHADLGRIDVMVNNAGHGHRASVIAATAADINEVYELDYRAYMMGAGAAARHMIKDGIQGNIVFITSSRGSRAYADDFIYCGMKAGIEHSSRAIAMDLSHYGIRVNCVAPGATHSGKPSPRRAAMQKQRAAMGPRPFVTQSIPMHRVGTAQDIGEMVAFVVNNEKAGYITGESFRVDGGLILPGLLEGNDHIPFVREGFWEGEYAKAFGEDAE